jgi:hypothetical protein
MMNRRASLAGDRQRHTQPLIVNLNTARTPGITIPQSLLLRADEVIQ